MVKVFINMTKPKQYSPLSYYLQPPPANTNYLKHFHFILFYFFPNLVLKIQDASIENPRAVHSFSFHIFVQSNIT